MAASSLLALFLPSVALADEKSDAYQFGKEGIAAAKAKQWDKAIDLFQKAVKADPKEANNYNNLGLAYKGAGKMDGSDQGLQRRDRGGAGEPPATSTAASFTPRRRSMTRRSRTSTRRSRSNPDSISAYRFRAFAYLQKKEYKKAVEDYNVVLKEKDDPAILDRRAFAYWNMKEYDKAIEDFSTDHQGQAERQGRLPRPQLRL